MSIADSDEDLPKDFFDDFTNNDFLAGLGAVADPDDLPVDTMGRRSGSSNVNDKHSSVMQEIERLERDIAERRKKLCRSTLRSRSSSVESGPRRRRSRSRSIGGKRRRSRSRSGRNRRRSRSRSRHRRSRSKGRKPSKDRNISFLEELAQKFAREGKPFPEAENAPLNMMPVGGYAPAPQINMMYQHPTPQPMHQTVHMYNQYPNPYAMGMGMGPAPPQPIDYPGGVIPVYPLPGLETISSCRPVSPVPAPYPKKRSIMDVSWNYLVLLKY